MTCTRCQGTGFLNIEQVPEATAEAGWEAVQAWMEKVEGHDVCICDCCGDMTTWHGTPGEHYGPSDLAGVDGPYAYNGGLCECH